MVVDTDAVLAVLDTWGSRRGAELVRRFDHGVGGTSLIMLDGVPRVLKAWQLAPAGSSGDEARLDHALHLAEIMRGRGVAVPELIERGRTDGYGYLVYACLDGVWSDELGAEALADLLAVIDAARDAAPAPNQAWRAELSTMLDRGDQSFDIAPGALAASPVAAAVLAEARRRLATCEPTGLRTSDVVHGDFAPENLLVRAGRVVGVVDWERARVGDCGLDLIGAIFDIEIGDKTTPTLRTWLWDRTRERMPADVLAAYVGIYAVRYLSWSVGTDMEDEVLDLVGRLLDRSTIGDREVDPAPENAVGTAGPTSR